MTYDHIKTVGDRHYLYRVTGVWDPEKKNSKQKRVYRAFDRNPRN